MSMLCYASMIYEQATSKEKWEMLLIINECQEKTSCIDSHIVINYTDLS